MHMHFIARTQKILTFMSQTGECRQQKHTQHAPSTKTECDYLNGWIKKRSHTQKSHPKMVNPRDIAVERRRREEEEVHTYWKYTDTYLTDLQQLVATQRVCVFVLAFFCFDLFVFCVCCCCCFCHYVLGFSFCFGLVWFVLYGLVWVGMG